VESVILEIFFVIGAHVNTVREHAREVDIASRSYTFADIETNMAFLKSALVHSTEKTVKLLMGDDTAAWEPHNPIAEL
jgi:hypothetical protein